MTGILQKPLCDLDPIYKELAALRMIEYLNSLMQNPERDFFIQESIQKFSEFYSDKWDKDKVITNK